MKHKSIIVLALAGLAMISHRKDAHYEGETPEKEGYVFAGWDQSLYGVCRDMVYHPVFEIAE